MVSLVSLITRGSGTGIAGPYDVHGVVVVAGHGWGTCRRVGVWAGRRWGGERVGGSAYGRVGVGGKRVGGSACGRVGVGGNVSAGRRMGVSALGGTCRRVGVWACRRWEGTCRRVGVSAGRRWEDFWLLASFSVLPAKYKLFLQGIAAKYEII